MPTRKIDPETAGQPDKEKAQKRAALELIIDKHLKDDFEVGKALHQIWKGELYQDTFARYVGTRFDMDRTRAYQLINAHLVHKILAGCVTNVTNEAQARPLARLIGEKNDEKVIKAIWESETKKAKGNRITAAMLATAVDKKLKPSVSPPPGANSSPSSSNTLSSFEALTVRYSDALKLTGKEKDKALKAILADVSKLIEAEEKRIAGIEAENAALREKLEALKARGINVEALLASAS